MPPCAATVCERVGKTLVMQAVLSPCSAMPSVARRPGAAGPDHDHVVGVVDELVCGHRVLSGQAKAILATAKMPVQREGRGQSSVLASSSADAQRLVVDIVLDHHLDALLQVAGSRRARKRIATTALNGWP